MKKRIFIIALCVILAFTLTFSAFAADIARCTDAAGLLTESEAAALNEKLDEMSERLQFDIAVVTMDSLDGHYPETVAESVWDQYNFGYGQYKDGVILLISMEERDWAITSTGWGQDYINEQGRSIISSAVVPYLSSGEYYDAFSLFADMCESMVVNYDNEEYRYEYYEPPFDFTKSAVIAIVIGVVIALIATAVMRGRLKSVKAQRAAANYVVQNSISLYDARERFLYSQVTKTARPQSSSRSSGGGSHSGHSSSHGKF